MGKPQDCTCGANKLVSTACLDTCPAWIPPYVDRSKTAYGCGSARPHRHHNHGELQDGSPAWYCGGAGPDSPRGKVFAFFGIPTD